MIPSVLIIRQSPRRILAEYNIRARSTLRNVWIVYAYARR